MFEIRIELVEVDRPGGEVQNTPLATSRTEATEGAINCWDLWWKLNSFIGKEE
jgi:hypothetical protein